MIPRALTPAAFAGRDPGANILTCAGESMGTSWSLQAVAPPAGVAEGVQEALDTVVAQMSQWEPASDLSRFNRAAAGAWHTIPAGLAQVVGAALDIAEASGGAFDPGLGALTECWGFGSAGPVDRVPGEPAAPPAAGGIDFDASTGRIRRGDGAALDLSGIAKGYGVDLAAEWLLAAGVRHFLIEVGGELRGEGIRPDGQPWWVDLELPPASPVAPYRIALHDLSVATSGNYRRGFADGGRYYSHSFDPRTRRPIAHDVSSVTVVHRSCMMADGWATALTVPGPEAAIALADERDLAACVLAGDAEYLSRAWREMLA
ncbi:thiamine biosynthesis lipoprotein [Sphingopyxis panaciterrae]|uniref:FAD:protein FMN transferase n=1 Tax=Sphingopyxis panaciterrae TaxID=363841 RepID=UPI001ABA8695|nr:FAD:protein FMN transferase [Sphingopyxis panaciterrae]NIJ37043.1 thiamine biosynthesis lipoprotein [Sphingopyxis panaciterrae]